MATNLPSRAIPFTDANGRISPVWHEFLRSFVADSVAGTVAGNNTVTTITAGNGLTSTGTSNVVLTVGQGSGIAVNADDVSVDIASQTYAQATLEDVLLIADVSDNNAIRKTKVSDIASPPGGLSTQVQYNNLGTLGGDSGFTTNGTGSVSIVGDLTVDAVNINGSTFASSANAGTNPFVFTVPAGSAATHYTFRQSGAGSSAMPVKFGSSLASTELRIDCDLDGGGSTLAQSALTFDRIGTTKWAMGLEGSSGGSKFIMANVSGLNTGITYNIDPTNLFFNMVTSLTRSTTAGLTASTTQTQGQQAITTDVAEISVCANANDTVTLPAALAGRSCLVINNGAQTLQIFPASGDNLGAGVDTATTVAAAGRKLFVAFDSTNWEPVI